MHVTDIKEESQREYFDILMKAVNVAGVSGCNTSIHKVFMYILTISFPPTIFLCTVTELEGPDSRTLNGLGHERETLTKMDTYRN